jgi:hypothetical protein
MHRVSNNNRGSQKREVLGFDFGVRVYPPASEGGDWGSGGRSATSCETPTARSRAAAIAKASEVVERLARSAPTALARAKGWRS